ncbi:hypothetical protein N7520_003550 [Penicillium odoratum]|uniref:uncharacterized protein n=1 Tax=Penicillium odoratum TaxID=1167516 RepID=UPI0025476E17|nr:uncharacterized protein N7520_003550 [Penicillium odoratum]KAJ5768991.1 hypothetical protein N7520_003550 [Penicillium odoratum]
MRHSNNGMTAKVIVFSGSGVIPTTLLYGIVEELTRVHRDSVAISFFFCQATNMRINSATSVLRGLIFLLIEKILSLLLYMRAQYDKAERTHYHIHEYTGRSVIKSRNHADITERFDFAAYIAPIPLELNETSISEAMNAFIRHKVDSLLLLNKNNSDVYEKKTLRSASE